MIESLHLENVGPAAELAVQWAPRLNLIAGDNGLGKSFLLDIAWWALTGTWANTMAMPNTHELALIRYESRARSGKGQKTVSKFSRANSAWADGDKRSNGAGIVVYIRVDGGFSVWDSARNDWRNDQARPAAYHFRRKTCGMALILAGNVSAKGWSAIG